MGKKGERDLFSLGRGWGESSSGGRVEGSHQRQRVGMRLDREGASNYLSGVSILRFHGDV